MSKAIDNKERTAAQTENRVQSLETIKLYTLTDLESVLGVTHRTLQSYIKDGRLKGVKLGGKWKVTEENLKRFLNGES